MKKNVIIGSIICLATVAIFLIFWGRLPDQVPIHFDTSGNVNSTLSKPAFVFGFPIGSALLNLLAGYKLVKKEEKKLFMYYLFPLVAVIAAILALVLAL